MEGTESHSGVRQSHHVSSWLTATGVFHLDRRSAARAELCGDVFFLLLVASSGCLEG